MKLKGKQLENISEERKERMKKTIEKMEDVRKEDNENLRKIIKDKLQFCEDEKIKGNNVIRELLKQIETLQNQVKYLDGAILALKDILGIKEKK